MFVLCVLIKNHRTVDHQIATVEILSYFNPMNILDESTDFNGLRVDEF